MALKKKKLTILLSITGLISLIALIGAFFYASSLISPEKIRTLALKVLQETFPKAEITLSRIELSPGFNFSLDIKKWEMQVPYAGKKYNLIKVDNLSVKIPIWSIITGGGTATLEMKKPQLSFIEYKKSNNWQLALGKSKTANRKTKKTSKKNTAVANTDDASTAIVALPAIASNIILNLLISDVELIYKGKKKNNGKVVISKFLVKNLNLKKSTAFEIDSKFNYQIKKNENISLKALVIGQFNIGSFLKDGTIPTLVMVKLSQVKLPPKFKMNIPEITTNINAVLTKEGSLSGNFDLSFDNRDKVSSNFSVNKQEIIIDKIKSKIFIKDLMKIIAFNDSRINADKTFIALDGKVSVKGEKKKIIPELNVKISPAIELKVDGLVIKNSTKIMLKNKILEVQNLLEVMEGVIETNIKTKVDLNNIQTDIDKLPLTNINVGIKNINVNKKFLQTLLYSKKGVSAKPRAAAVKNDAGNVEKKELPLIPLLPNSNLNITIDNIKIGDEKMNGEILIKVGTKQVALKKMRLNYARGEINAFTHSKFVNKGIDTKFNFDMNKFNFQGLSPFLPPYLKEVKGIASGKVSGKVKLLKNYGIKYDVIAKIEATDAEVKQLDLTDKIKALLGKVKFLKGAAAKMKNYPQNGRFEKLSGEFRLQETKYNLKKFFFYGSAKTAEFSGKGVIYPPVDDKVSNKLGKVYINFKDHTGMISKEIKKQTGSIVLPLLLIGKGYSLIPDAAYTTKKLGGKVINKQATKLAKKELKKLLKHKKVKKLLKNKEVKKNLDKLKKNKKLEKKIKNVFKGLF